MKKYSFSQVIQEINATSFAGNALSALGKKGITGGAMKGALYGAGIGAAGNVANNMLKDDRDPTKKGVLRSAIGGAMKGTVTGATVGSIGGGLAKTQWGKQAAASLQRSGQLAQNSAAMNEARQKAVQKLGDKAKNMSQKEIQKVISSNLDKSKLALRDPRTGMIVNNTPEARQSIRDYAAQRALQNKYGTIGSKFYNFTSAANKTGTGIKDSIEGIKNGIVDGSTGK